MSAWAAQHGVEVDVDHLMTKELEGLEPPAINETQTETESREDTAFQTKSNFEMQPEDENQHTIQDKKHQ